MKKLSWDDIENITDELADKIKTSGFVPDYIIGITIGGLIPLHFLAKKLGGTPNILTISVNSYNKDKKIPNWVAYELTKQKTQGNIKRNERFIADPVVKGGMANNSDYSRSGFDKGHMAPAADMKWSNEAMKESFYFSNVCPQHPELNRRKWKTLEDKVREWAVADSAILIICGPVTNKKSPVIGKSRVTVPSKFFKVILSLHGSTPKAIGFIFKNERAIAPLRNYAVSIDSIEQLTGLDFFSSLPDSLENEIESRIDTTLWSI